MTRGAVAAALLMVLAGCDRGGGDDERGKAAGEILPGSVSDAMLETDRLQAEAPLADPEAAEQSLESAERKTAGRRAAARDGGDAPAATSAPDPGPSPAPSPASTPTPEAPDAP